MTRIRLATSLDREDVRKIHLRAFSEDERQEVSTLAVNLLSEETSPETISLVTETDGALVGHVAFSPVTIDSRKNRQGYILAPLGVVPEYQNQRIGSKLIEDGMKRLSKTGVNVLFVYGDPKYYGKFGFNTDHASRYLPPYALKYPFGWQAVVLNEGITELAVVKISCVTSLCDPELW
jgi:putative acetyltransferase